MKYLLDTHFLLWTSTLFKPLSKGAAQIIENPENELFFSAASMWEIVIKSSLDKTNFQVDARVLRRALLDHNYFELPITSHHVLSLENLPALHKDPFDRILLAQAIDEGLILLTTDKTLLNYPAPVQLC